MIKINDDACYAGFPDFNRDSAFDVLDIIHLVNRIFDPEKSGCDVTHIVEMVDLVLERDFGELNMYGDITLEGNLDIVAGNLSLSGITDADSDNSEYSMLVQGNDMMVRKRPMIVDTDTQLDEVAVETFIKNGAIDLYHGSSINGGFWVSGEVSIAGGANIEGSVIINGLVELTDDDSDNQEYNMVVVGDDGLLRKRPGIVHTIDTDTQLTEAQVDAFVVNNGYSIGDHTADTNTQLTNAEVAAAATAEGFVSGPHTADTDTQLSEAQVDAFVFNNGYSTGNHTADTDTQLSEAQVDAFVYNNGYSIGDHTADTNTQLTNAEVAAAATAEGFVSGPHTADTNTQLSEAQVNAFVDNNGYATTDEYLEAMELITGNLGLILDLRADVIELQSQIPSADDAREYQSEMCSSSEVGASEFSQGAHSIEATGSLQTVTGNIDLYTITGDHNNGQTLRLISLGDEDWTLYDKDTLNDSNANVKLSIDQYLFDSTGDSIELIFMHDTWYEIDHTDIA